MRIGHIKQISFFQTSIDIISMRKINRVLLLFVAVVLPAGFCHGQEKTEGFPKFVERFVSDCGFQRSRVLFPVVALLHEEDTGKVVMVDEKDWGECVPFSDFVVKVGPSISDGATVMIVQGYDNGVLVEYRFGLVDNKWFLKRIEDYSM